MVRDGFPLVRTATQADREAIVELNPGLRRGGHGADRTWAALASGRVLVGELGGSVAGYLAWDYHFFDRAFVEYLVVLADYRRQGLGEALMREAIARCDTRDVFTSTNQSNLRMQALLAKLGFEHCGKVDALDPGDPELFYVLRRAHVDAEQSRP